MALTIKQINIILSVIIVIFTITLIALISYYTTRSPKQNIAPNSTSDKPTVNSLEPDNRLYNSFNSSISQDPPPPSDPSKTIVEVNRSGIKPPTETISDYKPSLFDKWFNPGKIRDEQNWRKTLGQN